MGDVADSMLDGTLCEGCGVYVGQGHMECPQYCRNCNGDHAPISEKIKCNFCDKKLKRNGMQDHINAVHKDKILKPGAYNVIVKEAKRASGKIGLDIEFDFEGEKLTFTLGVLK